MYILNNQILKHVAAHDLPSIVTKIVTSLSYVIIHIQWNQRMKCIC